MKRKKENFIIYDTKDAKQWEGIFDIATPEEVANAFALIGIKTIIE